MAGLEEDQKWLILTVAYKEAVSQGIPFCQYLQDKAEGSMAGAGSVEGRRIVSTSDGGQSVSYGNPGDDPISESAMSSFLPTAARRCQECPGTDEEKLNCLLGSEIMVDPRYKIATYRSLRGCGC